MTTINVELPEKLRKEVDDLAVRDQLPVERLLEQVIKQYVEGRLSSEWIRQRATRADPKRLAEILNLAPDVEPEAFDRI